MEFLSISAVRERAQQVRKALEALLSSPAVAHDREAKQWRFLAASVEALFERPGADFRRLTAAGAAQLKFPVHQRLREYYARHAGQAALELMLVHESQLRLYRLPDAEEYPRLAGYSLLVRDRSSDVTLPPDGADRTREYVERVVTEAAQAELRAYRSLPDASLEPLQPWFVPDGPAWLEIQDRLQRRRRDGWVLSNPLNPSTVRTLSVQVRSLGEDDARVVARESWYLLWWSQRTRSYLYAFRESMQHSYVVQREAAGWRVRERAAKRPRAL